MKLTPIQHRQIIELVIAAGQQALRLREIGALNPRHKNEHDYSIVTDADYASHKIITEGLAGIFPGIPVISEEDEVLSPTGYYKIAWITDPIDSTTNFSRGGTRFSVLVSYVENGYPEHGFAYYPDRKHSVIYYTGVDDNKAFKQKIETVSSAGQITFGQKIPLVTRTCTSIPRLIQSYTDVRDLFPSGFTEPKHNCGHSCAAIFEGQADIIAGPTTMMDWDLAALDAILRRCGAAYISIDTKQPLIYGRERSSQIGFSQDRYIAGNLGTLIKYGLVDEISSKLSVRR